MKIKPIIEVRGALARSDGLMRWPDLVYSKKDGSYSVRETKWRKGAVCRANKGVKHCYLNNVYRRKSYKVHQLICRAFHGDKPDEKSVVIHIDENALNNKPENLKWGTQKENLNSKGFIEYCKSRTGSNNPRAKGKRNAFYARLNNL